MDDRYSLPPDIAAALERARLQVEALAQTADELIDPDGAVFVDHDLDDVGIREGVADRRSEDPNEFLVSAAMRLRFNVVGALIGEAHAKSAGILRTSSKAEPPIVSIATASSGSSRRNS